MDKQDKNPVSQNIEKKTDLIIISPEELVKLGLFQDFSALISSSSSPKTKDNATASSSTPKKKPKTTPSKSAQKRSSSSKLCFKKPEASPKTPVLKKNLQHVKQLLTESISKTLASNLDKEKTRKKELKVISDDVVSLSSQELKDLIGMAKIKKDCASTKDSKVITGSGPSGLMITSSSSTVTHHTSVDLIPRCELNFSQQVDISLSDIQNDELEIISRMKQHTDETRSGVSYNKYVEIAEENDKSRDTYSQGLLDQKEGSIGQEDTTNKSSNNTEISELSDKTAKKSQKISKDLKQKEDRSRLQKVDIPCQKEDDKQNSEGLKQENPTETTNIDPSPESNENILLKRENRILETRKRDDAMNHTQNHHPKGKNSGQHSIFEDQQSSSSTLALHHECRIPTEEIDCSSPNTENLKQEKITTLAKEQNSDLVQNERLFLSKRRRQPRVPPLAKRRREAVTDIKNPHPTAETSSISTNTPEHRTTEIILENPEEDTDTNLSGDVKEELKKETEESVSFSNELDRSEELCTDDLKQEENTTVTKKADSILDRRRRQNRKPLLIDSKKKKAEHTNDNSVNNTMEMDIERGNPMGRSLSSEQLKSPSVTVTNTGKKTSELSSTMDSSPSAVPGLSSNVREEPTKESISFSGELESSREMSFSEKSGLPLSNPVEAAESVSAPTDLKRRERSRRCRIVISQLHETVGKVEKPAYEVASETKSAVDEIGGTKIVEIKELASEITHSSTPLPNKRRRSMKNEDEEKKIKKAKVNSTESSINEEKDEDSSIADEIVLNDSSLLGTTRYDEKKGNKSEAYNTKSFLNEENGSTANEIILNDSSLLGTTHSEKKGKRSKANYAKSSTNEEQDADSSTANRVTLNDSSLLGTTPVEKKGRRSKANYAKSSTSEEKVAESSTASEVTLNDSSLLGTTPSAEKKGRRSRANYGKSSTNEEKVAESSTSSEVTLNDSSLLGTTPSTEKKGRSKANYAKSSTNVDKVAESSTTSEVTLNDSSLLGTTPSAEKKGRSEANYAKSSTIEEKVAESSTASEVTLNDSSLLSTTPSVEKKGRRSKANYAKSSTNEEKVAESSTAGEVTLNDSSLLGTTPVEKKGRRSIANYAKRSTNEEKVAESSTASEVTLNDSSLLGTTPVEKKGRRSRANYAKRSTNEEKVAESSTTSEVTLNDSSLLGTTPVEKRGRSKSTYVKSSTNEEKVAESSTTNQVILNDSSLLGTTQSAKKKGRKSEANYGKSSTTEEKDAESSTANEVILNDSSLLAVSQSDKRRKSKSNTATIVPTAEKEANSSIVNEVILNDRSLLGTIQLAEKKGKKSKANNKKSSSANEEKYADISSTASEERPRKIALDEKSEIKMENSEKEAEEGKVPLEATNRTFNSLETSGKEETELVDEEGNKSASLDTIGAIKSSRKSGRPRKTAADPTLSEEPAVSYPIETSKSGRARRKINYLELELNSMKRENVLTLAQKEDDKSLLLDMDNQFITPKKTRVYARKTKTEVADTEEDKSNELTSAKYATGASDSLDGFKHLDASALTKKCTFVLDTSDISKKCTTVLDTSSDISKKCTAVLPDTSDIAKKCTTVSDTSDISKKCTAVSDTSYIDKKFTAVSDNSDVSKKCTAVPDPSDVSKKCTAVSDTSYIDKKFTAVSDNSDVSKKCTAVSDTSDISKKCTAVPDTSYIDKKFTAVPGTSDVSKKCTVEPDTSDISKKCTALPDTSDVSKKCTGVSDTFSDIDKKCTADFGVSSDISESNEGQSSSGGDNVENSLSNIKSKYIFNGYTTEMLSSVFSAAFRGDQDGSVASPSPSLQEPIGKKRRGRPKKFADDVLDKGESDSIEVSCVVCDEKLLNGEWYLHNAISHYNLAWRKGESPLNLDDDAFVKRKMKLLMPKSKILDCKKCGRPCKDVDAFIVHREECLGILVNGVVTCVICNAQMDRKTWPSHKLNLHNNLAWRVGDIPLDLNDQDYVMSVLNALYKIKKPLYCDKCKQSKKSVVGFLSHRSQCGVLLEDAKIECKLCGKKVLPVSMPSHIRLVHETPKKTPDESYYFNVDPSASKKKRRAARDAMLIIESFTSGGESKGPQVNPYKTSPVDFKEEKYMIPLLENELKANSMIRCKFEDCSFTTDNVESFLDHLTSCPKTPTEFHMCTICLAICVSETDIRRHVTDVHDVFLPNDDDSDGESFTSGEEHEMEQAAKKQKKRSDIAKLQRRHRLKPSCITYLSKESGILFNSAFQFTWEFCSDHYSEPVLYDKFRHFAWNLLPSDLINNYLPVAQSSCDVASTSVRGFDNVLGQEYAFKRFDLCEVQRKDVHTTIFCGGPITAMSWAPTPHTSRDAVQVLAVATARDFDSKYRVNAIYEEPSMIQFWDFGLLANKGPYPEPSPMLFLALDCGPIWHMEWCPSGCYDQAESEFERLGLLAVAGSVPAVFIYSIPLVKDEEKRGLIYKEEPLLKLQLHPSNTTLKTDFYPTKISWTKAAGHKYIAVGYSDGMVALFNVHSPSPLLLIKEADGGGVLLPYRVIPAHKHYISALSLVHLQGGDKLLLTGSFDKDVHLWNLERRTKITSSKKRIVTDGTWLTNWLSYVTTSDDSNCVNNVTSATVTAYRNYLSDPSPIMFSKSAINSITFSDWLNGFIQGNEVGEVQASFQGQMLYSLDAVRKGYLMRFILGYTKLIDKRKPPDVRVAEEADKQKIITIAPGGSRNSLSELAESSDVVYNYFEPITYAGATKKYGLVFCDFKLNSPADFPAALQKKLSGRHEVLDTSKPSLYCLQAANKVCFNPNRQASLYFAVGYQAGFVRVSYLRFLEKDGQIRKSM